MTNATNKTVILYDFPEWPDETVYNDLLTDPAPGAGNELIDNATFAETLDTNGQASGYLPTPDNTGEAAYRFRARTPGGGQYVFSVAYDAAPQSLKALLAAGVTLAEPSVVGVSPAEKTFLDSLITAIPDPTDIAVFTDADAAVYVSSVGSDSNDGLSPDSPLLTIGAGMTAAAALITVGASNVEVRIPDGGI